MAQLMTWEVFEKDPKSHQIREVTIDEGTRALLVDHLEQQRRTALRLGSTLSGRAYVLADLSVDAEGLAPTHPNRLTQAFGRLRRKVPGPRTFDSMICATGTPAPSSTPGNRCPLLPPASAITSRRWPRSTPTRAIEAIKQPPTTSEASSMAEQRPPLSRR